MPDSQPLGLTAPRVPSLGLAAGLLLLALGFASTPWAMEQPTVAPQEQVIVSIHSVATRVSIAVDNLVIQQTDSVFGVWNYQFNLSSWLDTEPQTVTVTANFGNRDKAYCTVQIRRMPAGNPDASTILAEKMLRGSDVEKTGGNTVLALDIARPQGAVRPLWADYSQADLQGVIRKKSLDLVREVFEAIQACDLERLLALIGPALTNQALMEGADPELVKRSFLALLRRDCIPRIPVAAKINAYHNSSYEDIMAPLEFDKMVYKFSLDESREDKRGNLYTPTKTIVFKNRFNEGFIARPFLSYTDDSRKQRFISRFLFQRTH